MKKNLFIILGIFLIIIVILTYFYYNYKKAVLIASQTNMEYEKYISNGEIKGSTLLTIINKAVDQNEKNEIAKNEKNRYLENNENFIKVEVKFKESDKTYAMEAIYAMGYEEFIKNYSNLDFICSKKEYHKKTNQIKYLLFEQI